jgi:hypothetical protein
MPVVRTPSRTFSGERAGVTFVNGTATCDARTASLLARLGYEVLGDPEPVKTPDDANVLPSRPSDSDIPPVTRTRKARQPKGTQE